jgi:hypothetical protein
MNLMCLFEGRRTNEKCLILQLARRWRRRGGKRKVKVIIILQTAMRCRKVEKKSESAKRWRMKLEKEE